MYLVRAPPTTACDKTNSATNLTMGLAAMSCVYWLTDKNEAWNYTVNLLKTKRNKQKKQTKKQKQRRKIQYKTNCLGLQQRSSCGSRLVCMMCRYHGPMETKHGNKWQQPPLFWAWFTTDYHWRVHIQTWPNQVHQPYLCLQHCTNCSHLKITLIDCNVVHHFRFT